MKMILVVSSFLALGAAGCGKPWVIIHQGSELQSSAQLAVEQTTFDNVNVGRKDEAEYLSKKTPEQQAGWQGDKMAFAGAFASSTISHGQPFNIAGPDAAAGRALVKSHVTMIEPGNFNGFVNIATEVRTRVTITDASQAPQDEIELRCVVGASMYRPTVSQRMNDCGTATGAYLARYLRDRAHVK